MPESHTEPVPPDPTPTLDSPVPAEPTREPTEDEPATQMDEDHRHPEETSNGRNKPNGGTPPTMIATTSAAATDTPTAVLTAESGASDNEPSRPNTAALAGILVALVVVFIAALAALACIKRKKNQRRGRAGGGRRRTPIDDDKEGERAPPSYEAAVFGSTDNARWNEHYGIYNPPQQPEQPVLQSPEPVHHVIHSPRPISATSTTALNRLDPITAPQQRPVSQEIIIFPHDSPILGPQDDNISLQAALRLSQQSNTVLYSQPTSSGRFTENFDDSASVVSELTEEERIAEVEMV